LQALAPGFISRRIGKAFLADREAVDRFLVSAYGRRWSEGGGVDELDALRARRARA
jgi:hypothetical protein